MHPFSFSQVAELVAAAMLASFALHIGRQALTIVLRQPSITPWTSHPSLSASAAQLPVWEGACLWLPLQRLWLPLQQIISPDMSVQLLQGRAKVFK